MKQVIQFVDREGDPFLVNVNGSFLTIGTTQGIVKVFDLSRRFTFLQKLKHILYKSISVFKRSKTSWRFP